jgi:hypothetical protein
LGNSAPAMGRAQRNKGLVDRISFCRSPSFLQDLAISCLTGMLNPIFLPEPLLERLYSAKISPAFWLVRF